MPIVAALLYVLFFFPTFSTIIHARAWKTENGRQEQKSSMQRVMEDTAMTKLQKIDSVVFDKNNVEFLSADHSLDQWNNKSI